LDSGEENTTKVARFANYLRILLPGVEPQITVLAAQTLGILIAYQGHLATSASTLTSEFVEFEMKRALEWLQGLFLLMQYLGTGTILNGIQQFWLFQNLPIIHQP
jgi:hypothetical protein